MPLYLTVSLANVLKKEKKQFVLSGANGYECTVGYGKVTVPLTDAQRYSAAEDDYIPMSKAYGTPGLDTFDLNAKGIELCFPPAEEAPCYYFSDEDAEEIYAMDTKGAWLAEH